MKIGPYSYEEYLGAVKSFHGYTAPGLVAGGFMVDLALSRMPGEVLFEAVSETRNCLPDAIQLLTPCTVGNGWLKIINLGRFALSLYDKYSGEGVRVYVDAQKIRAWPEVEAWLFKLKTKREQDGQLLLEQIREAGPELYGIQAVRVQPQFLGKRRRGGIGCCNLCGEPYPVEDGAICRACAGEAPYLVPGAERFERIFDGPALDAVPIEDAVGKTALHDMTMIVPGKSKGAAFVRGQQFSVGDLCRLQQMGKQRVYVEESRPSADQWIHENEAALTFARAMAGEGVRFIEPAREGKINFVADRSGLFVADEACLEEFNMIPGVMCASRRSYTPVSGGRNLAGTRRFPLPPCFFPEGHLGLRFGASFASFPAQGQGGHLVTGQRTFQGLVKDRFIPSSAPGRSAQLRVVRR